jgi:DNA-binding transcriptional MerR regulator
MSKAYSLADLENETGIESRTIRSYIERCLLPNAHARGRAATYSDEHLTRLRVIQALRRARPNITLADIRIVLHQLTPEQIRAFARGSITAGALSIGESSAPDDDDSTFDIVDSEESPLPATNWEVSAVKLTGAQRLVQLLRNLSLSPSSPPHSKAEGWQRISVTPDVELCVRTGFDANQLDVFRELADLIRHVLQHPDAMENIGKE